MLLSMELCLNFISDCSLLVYNNKADFTDFCLIDLEFVSTNFVEFVC